MSEAILNVNHLRKSFGNNEILKDIDFSVKPKDVTCIIEPSGSGKSTLLRCMNLLETTSTGEILYHGRNITLLDAANDAGVPILKSARPTSRVIVRITNYLESRFAPTTAVHGVLVDIYGVGVLILGQSGVGKSETALELVKRGHRLVADDSVEIRQEDYDTRIGSAPALIEHLLEIRGLGILNIMTLFGAGAVKKFKRISFVVQLELWDDKKQYERLGIEEEMMKIMD